MKTQLIILEQGNIIVSDDEINEGDLVYESNINKIFPIHKHGLPNFNLCRKKIIASDNPSHNLPIIDYNGLEEKFGIVDLEKLVDKYYGDSDYAKESKIGFIKGFKKSQSLNDKKFSLEDMNKILSYLTSPNLTDEYRVVFARKHIQSLQQLKVFNIEVEMVEGWKDCSEGVFETNHWQPKITNNSIKITKVL